MVVFLIIFGIGTVFGGVFLQEIILCYKYI